MRKCVFVIGKEGTGGALVARTISQALGVQDFDSWDGNAPYWSENQEHKVYHTSLPFFSTRWPDVGALVETHRECAQFFVITTRDVSISEKSKMIRCGKTEDRVRRESSQAREILSRILRSPLRFYVFSYETFMYLRDDYLRLLYGFLDIESDFMPPLEDANVKYLKPLL